MVVGCCSIKLVLHGNRSLKGKRSVLRTIKDRMKNKFNISVSEVGDQDVWQVLHLGIAAVSSDFRYMEGLMAQVVHFIDNLHLAEMSHQESKIIRFGDDEL